MTQSEQRCRCGHMKGQHAHGKGECYGQNNPEDGPLECDCQEFRSAEPEAEERPCFFCNGRGKDDNLYCLETCHACKGTGRGPTFTEGEHIRHERHDAEFHEGCRICAGERAIHQAAVAEEQNREARPSAECEHPAWEAHTFETTVGWRPGTIAEHIPADAIVVCRGGGCGGAAGGVGG